jgi:membrane protein DedA with SNARE-associated domain
VSKRPPTVIRVISSRVTVGIFLFVGFFAANYWVGDSSAERALATAFVLTACLTIGFEIRAWQKRS